MRTISSLVIVAVATVAVSLPVAGQTPTPTPFPAPNCAGFEYQQMPVNLQWGAPRAGDQEFGSGITAEEGIVDGAGALVALAGAGITRVRVWGYNVDYNNFPTSGHNFCDADRFTPWNLTFRAVSADPQIPGDVIATREVVASSGLPVSAGRRFATPTPCTATNNADGCFAAGQWTLDFPPVPSADVRWIGVQKQTGNNAADGHPCAFLILPEVDATTYDDEYYERGNLAENVNQDLQICIGTSNLATLDIDGNGVEEALTDGLLLIRKLFGFTGAAVVGGATGDACTRCFPNIIEPYIDALAMQVDVDKNGVRQALTDGILILRYLFGFRDAALITGAVGDQCDDCSADEIEANIALLVDD